MTNMIPLDDEELLDDEEEDTEETIDPISEAQEDKTSILDLD